MMSLHAGRNAVRLFPSYACTLRYRVDAAPALVHRVAAHFSSRAKAQQEASLLESITGPIVPSASKRTSTSPPKSRPKGHTGRTTAKPRTAKAAPASKSASTKKAAAPKVKKAAKAKAKKAVKRVLTPEQQAKKKEAVKVKKHREHIAELKTAALKKPTALPSTAFTVLMQAEQFRSIGKATERSRAASKEYKEMSSEDRRHYEDVAAENTKKNDRAYKEWIESYTPAQVREANLARHNLKRGKVAGSWTKLKDEREVKAPAQAHALFLKSRHASGDLHGVAAPDAIKQIMREWSNLGQSEKQQYLDQAASDKERYVREMKQVYNITPTVKAAASAA